MTTASPELAAEWAERMNPLPGHAVRAAVSTGLAEQLDTWTTLTSIHRAIDADPTAVRVLVEYLESLGLVEREGGTKLRLTPAGRLMLVSDPYGFAQHWHTNSFAHRIEAAFAQLEESVRTGTPCYELAHRTNLYRDLRPDSGHLAEAFSSAKSLTQHSARRLAEWIDIPEGSTITELGCGVGQYLCAVLSARPSLTGVGVDLPAVVAHAESDWATQDDVQGRIRGMACDIFEDVPTGADLYLLCNVLVDLPEQRATALLGRVARADDEVRLVVVELASDLAPPALVTHMNLHQFAMTGGRLRSSGELRAIGELAGFACVDETALGGGILALSLLSS
ncbi:methyltransferase [Luteipulveratus flavus]|uniref:Methyltransferase n=1 Tax=Luteipulveratus flavus TaxID=3031728 RepID=A0ABT6CBW6_9MICO|nr:methyltransferase [Luteipulveratus sp. YIM 133296]MDF8264761.1 methyltransferase [Luteipulveratus sp. YIM 133296]